jgi:hypothetical protein
MGNRDFKQLARGFKGVQWFDGFRYRLYEVPERLRSAEPREVLAAFMRDDSFDTWLHGPEEVGDYDPSPSHISEYPPGHGPFEISKLTPDSFRRVSPFEMLSHLQKRLSEDPDQDPHGGFVYDGKALRLFNRLMGELEVGAVFYIDDGFEDGALLMDAPRILTGLVEFICLADAQSKLLLLAVAAD